MVNGIIKILIPDYMEKFRCTGHDCSDTCCAGWDRISIDYETYMKYSSIEEDRLRKIIENKIKLWKEPDSKFYAEFILKNDSSCPFLTENKLCHMQIIKGEDYLPCICFVYPRAYNIVNGRVEKSAVLSCPEAARLALTNPGGITFNEIVAYNENFKYLFNALNINESQLDSKNKYFTKIREAAIKIVGDKDRKIRYSLLVLGLFLKEIEEMALKAQSCEIQQFIDYYIKNLKNICFNENVPERSSFLQFKLGLLIPQVSRINNFNIPNRRFAVFIKEFLHGVNCGSTIDLKKISMEYLSAYKSYYAPFITRHEYIMKNYLVNYIFKNLFPLSFKGNTFDQYIFLVLNYSIINMLLTGVAGYKKGMDKDTAVNLIQAYTKTMEYDYNFFKGILDCMKGGNYKTLDYVAALINN